VDNAENDARLLRERDALRYLGGMGHGSFWKLRVNGHITPVRLGRSVFFDRADLDRLIEHLKTYGVEAMTARDDTPTKAKGSKSKKLLQEARQLKGKIPDVKVTLKGTISDHAGNAVSGSGATVSTSPVVDKGSLISAEDLQLQEARQLADAIIKRVTDIEEFAKQFTDTVSLPFDDFPKIKEIEKRLDSLNTAVKQQTFLITEHRHAAASLSTAIRKGLQSKAGVDEILRVTELAESNMHKEIATVSGAIGKLAEDMAKLQGDILKMNERYQDWRQRPWFKKLGG